MNWVFETYKDVYATAFTREVSAAEKRELAKKNKTFPSFHALGFLPR